MRRCRNCISCCKAVTSNGKTLLKCMNFMWWDTTIFSRVLDAPCIERVSKQLRVKHLRIQRTHSVGSCFLAMSTWYGSSSGHSLAPNRFSSTLSPSIATSYRHQISVPTDAPDSVADKSQVFHRDGNFWVLYAETKEMRGLTFERRQRELLQNFCRKTEFSSIKFDFLKRREI